MSLTHLTGRLRRIRKRLAPRPRNPVPTTEYEFYEGLLTRKFSPRDIDQRNIIQMNWLAEAAIVLSAQIALAEAVKAAPPESKCPNSTA
jgi:hypothetical protein